MKTHLNLSSAHLEKSVAFYGTLLNAEPRKNRADYALFITEDPALELAIDFQPDVPPTHAAHFGVAVDSTEAVNSAIERLIKADFDTVVEREETCCYANQTKVSATDPDGRRWEIYTVHEETEVRTSCCD